jgi:hypothetical protein
MYHYGVMDQRESLVRSRILAGMLLVSLIADILLKNPIDMQEVMWACYWASVSVVAGIFFRSDMLVSWGFIFFIGLGLPAWLLGILMSRKVDITSVLIHTVPLVAALYYVKGMRELPKYSFVGAWLLYVVPFGLAWRFCNAEAMINLSHWVQRPLLSVLPRQWEFYLLLMILSAVMVMAASGVMNYILVQRVHSDGIKTGLGSGSKVA